MKSVILISEWPMSVICKVKIPKQITIFLQTQRSTDISSHVGIDISVICGLSFIFVQSFFFFLFPLSAQFEKHGSCIGNKCFDGIQSSSSAAVGLSSHRTPININPPEEFNLQVLGWMTCQHAVRNVFLSLYSS